MASLFRKSRTLKPIWILETANQNEIIWKLLISPSGILVGEERDVEQKWGTLFALQVDTGNVLWRHRALEEPWWFGSEKATQDSIFIQTFHKPDLPESKGIIALDIRTGETRWTRPEMSFLFAENRRTYAMQPGYSHRIFFAMDEMTGEIVEEYGEDDSDVAAARSSSSEIDSYSHFAESLGGGIAEKDQLFDALNDTIDPGDLRGPIEFLEFGGYRIFSFHARAKGAEAMLKNLLTNEIVVVQAGSGQLLFRETLHAETPLPLPDNFFVTHGTLIYVKEKRTLAGIELL